MADNNDVSIILSALRNGEDGARSALFHRVHDELRQMAQKKMKAERPGHTLQPTALVGEAYLKLCSKEDRTWENRAHFFSSAAEAMRQVLIDWARARGREKRGGGRQRLELDEGAVVSQENTEFLALNEALERLDQQYERHGKVVRLRYILGLSAQETADILDVSLRTVEKDWAFAKSWLRVQIEDKNDQWDQ